MFRKFEVPGIVVVPAQPLAIFPTQETTALIIDCGFYDTTVVPVAQRIVLSHAHRTVAIGARAVYAKMSQLLSTYPSVYTTSSASDTNTSHNNAPVPYDSEANQNEEDAEGEGAPEENPASQWCRTLSTMLRSGGVVLRRGTSPIATGTTMTNWSPPSSLSKQTYRIDHGAIWQQAPLALFDTDDEGHSLASVILDSLLKVRGMVVRAVQRCDLPLIGVAAIIVSCGRAAITRTQATVRWRHHVPTWVSSSRVSRNSVPLIVREPAKRCTIRVPPWCVLSC
jgi:hypothetical protein